jgi:hypothetical protein
VEQFAALVPLIGLQPPVRHHPAAGGDCQPGQFG